MSLWFNFEVFRLSKELRNQTGTSLMDLLQELEVIEKWDCYNDCPSGEYQIIIKGITDKQTVTQVKGLIELLRISHITERRTSNDNS